VNSISHDRSEKLRLATRKVLQPTHHYVIIHGLPAQDGRNIVPQFISSL
jgi:hypothetical protein